MGKEAPVNRQIHTRNPPRVRTRQENGRSDNVLGLADAVQRVLGLELGLVVKVGNRVLEDGRRGVCLVSSLSKKKCEVTYIQDR
jgi:hypothetical protein